MTNQPRKISPAKRLDLYDEQIKQIAEKRKAFELTLMKSIGEVFKKHDLLKYDPNVLESAIAEMAEKLKNAKP
ncbi:MAG: hypothetical protein Q7V63_06280 [Gammaproteobacteria bacterium]|nr:hypothetical protein [Gammaproteobacteria bacterium]